MYKLNTKGQDEIIEKVSKNKAIRYTVSEEVINLDLLKDEKERLLIELEETEPTIEELAEYGRTIHPYYQKDDMAIGERISTINKLTE